MGTQVRNSFISVDEARETILHHIWDLETEMAGAINALGKTLADDILAERDIPEIDTAEADGYALIAAETKDAAELNQKRFSVLCELTAGGFTDKEVVPGTAVSLKKGATIPRGADAVVTARDCFREDVELYVMREAQPGENIRRRAAEVRKGETVLAKGAVLSPKELYLLTTVAKTGVPVKRKPRVAVLTVDNEEPDITSHAPASRARAAERYLILGQILSSACELGPIVQARENHESIVQGLAKALRADAVVISGGSHGGEQSAAAETLGIVGKIHVSRIAAAPGRQFTFAMVEAKPVFALSKGAASAIVEFEVFVRPALMRMAGRSDIDRQVVTATVGNDIRQSFCQRQFLRAHTVWENGGYSAEVVDVQHSGRMRHICRHNSLIIVREDRGDIRRGEPVEVMLLG